MEDLTGQQFGPYQVIAPLGEGGMAAVYKAFQPAMERYVALKILPRHYANAPQFVSRFKREAKVLAQLQHPHILPVFDFGESEGYTYLAMPLIKSGTLTDLLQGEPLPFEQIRLIIAQMGGALAYAHTHGFIHRDVKPSNVLIDESGNCLLSDFGLAMILEGSEKLTASGAVIGTPAYMSPEQGMGKTLDGRSDLYSLSVILYEMATGRPPYKADTPMAVMIKHITDPLPLPRLLNPAIPETLELVILKGMAKNPEDRYPTAGELVRAVEAALPTGAVMPMATAAATGSESSKTPKQPPVERPKRPRKWALGLLGFAMIGLTLICGLSAALVIGLNLANRAQTSPSTDSTPETKPIPRLTILPTDELSPDWQAIGGSWTGPNENGVIYGKTAAFDGDALYLFKSVYSDFTFSAEVQALTREASLAVRMSQDGKHGYLVIFIPRGSKGGNPGLWLSKRIAGNHTSLAFFATDYVIGEWVQLTVKARGSQISVSVNGDQAIDFKDANQPFTSGKLGFRCYGEPAAPCEANFSGAFLSR